MHDVNMVYEYIYLYISISKPLQDREPTEGAINSIKFKIIDFWT